MWPHNKYCGCGAMVWDVPKHKVPAIGKPITCWNCQADHTRKPPVLYQVWWVRDKIHLSLRIKRLRIKMRPLPKL